MKNILYILLITSLFFSCKSNTKQAAKDSTNTINSTDNKGAGLIQKFKPIIQGVWVKKDYIDKVLSKKSPLAAADEATGMTTMYINTDRIKGDSITVPVGWGNHEGSELMLKFRPGKAASTIQFGDGDLGYSVENGDTLLVISRLDEDEKKIITTKYSKALNKQPDGDLGYGMAYIINKNLVAGNYTLTDSTGTSSKVTFNADGKVSGFYNFKEFMINIDLNSDPMENLDEIGFDYDKKDHASYSFKIDANNLNLYATHPNADSTELVLGKLAYKLVRQK